MPVQVREEKLRDFDMDCGSWKACSMFLNCRIPEEALLLPWCVQESPDIN